MKLCLFQWVQQIPCDLLAYKGWKKYKKWYSECKETFSKGFIIIAGYYYNGKLTICCVAQKTKVNSCTIKLKFCPQFTTLKSRLRMVQTQTSCGCIKIRHQVIFLVRPSEREWNKKQEYMLYPSVTFQWTHRMHLPCIFVPLGFWKGHWEIGVLYNGRPMESCKEEWGQMDMAVLHKSLQHWKLRCRAVARMKGYQIDHDRWWRRGFS